MWYNNILEIVGNTPLVKLNSITNNVKPTILVKLEFLGNAGASVKSRTAFHILKCAEKEGKLKPKYTIVDSSGGNTAIGMGMYGAIKGYNVKVTVSETLSPQKYNLLKALGVELIVCPDDVPSDSNKSAYWKARELAKATPNSYLLDQHNNEKNLDVHYKTTGPEVWEQTGHRIDYVVGGIGTGGTISGIAKFLKERKPEVKVIGVESKGSVYREYLNNKKLKPANGFSFIEGIGNDKICKVIKFELIDDIVQVADKDAFFTARRLLKEEGVFAGGSAGAALWAAMKIAKKLDKDKIIVAILPDSGNNYLNTIFNDEWMQEKGFIK